MPPRSAAAAATTAPPPGLRVRHLGVHRRRHELDAASKVPAELHGATDLVMDPQNPQHLWASSGATRSTSPPTAALTWTASMGGLPPARLRRRATRFSMGSPTRARTAPDDLRRLRLRLTSTPTSSSTTDDGGTTWTDATGRPSGPIGRRLLRHAVLLRQRRQARPDQPQHRLRARLLRLRQPPQSGGIYRSVDGGAHWLSLGYDLHPDFHAIAFQPNDPRHIAIGNDGGVWQFHGRGGALGRADPSATPDWENLNGTVDPNTARPRDLDRPRPVHIHRHRSPGPREFWGGTQDNGTLRKSIANAGGSTRRAATAGRSSSTRPTPTPATSAFPAWVLVPLRISPTGTTRRGTFFGNERDRRRHQPKDRSEFYVPWAQNRGNPNQMFLGTYRLYRTDNAEAPRRRRTWKPISGDLTSGCTGPAPNGAARLPDLRDRRRRRRRRRLRRHRRRLHPGQPERVTSDTPTWTRVGAGCAAEPPGQPVRRRPVELADRLHRLRRLRGGDARPTAATCSRPPTAAHLTTSPATCPTSPVNSVVIDPSDANTSTSAPTSAPSSDERRHAVEAAWAGGAQGRVWQLDYDATNGVLAAGTHGRGAYTLDNRGARPALVVSKADWASRSARQHDPLHDHRAEHRQRRRDRRHRHRPVPAHTTFVSADRTAAYVGGGIVNWTDLTFRPAAVDVTSLRLDRRRLAATVGDRQRRHQVVVGRGRVHDGQPAHHPDRRPVHGVGCAGGADATGPGWARRSATRDRDEQRLHARQLHPVHVRHMADDGLRRTCTTPLTTTPRRRPGDTVDVCVKVDVPAVPRNGARTTRCTATSTGLVASPRRRP